MFKKGTVFSLLCALLLGAGSASAATPAPFQVAQTEWRWVQVLGYKLAIPAHFKTMSNPADGASVWRFGSNTMQVKIRAWQKSGLTGESVVQSEFDHFSDMAKKTVRADKDMTEALQAKSNSSAYYIDGDGFFQTQKWGYILMGFSNLKTTNNLSIRAVWTYQSTDEENRAYRSIVHQMANSVTESF